MNVEFEHILKKLRGFIRQEYLEQSLYGGQLFVIVSSSLFLVFVLLESLFHFDSVIRTIILSVWGFSSISLFAYYFCIPLFNRFKNYSTRTYLEAANIVGKHYPDVNDEIRNALELYGQQNNTHASSAFVKAAFQFLYKKIKEIDFAKIVSFQRCFAILRYTLISGLGVLFLVLLVPQLHASAGRLFLCRTDFTAPAKYLLKISPGNTKIIKGEDVLLNVVIVGGAPASLDLYVKDQEQNKSQKFSIEQDSTGNYRYIVKAVRSDIEYWCSLEGVQSEHYKITVVNNPIVQEIIIKIKSPSYSGIKETEQKDNGNISCLFGSNLEFKITSSKVLKEAFLVIRDSQYVKLQVSEFAAYGAISAKGEWTYKIIIKDVDGNTNVSPVVYSVKTFTDVFPVIEILSPEQNTILTSEQRINLTLKLSDDYGFNALKLYYRLSASRYEKPEESYQVVSIPFDKSKKDEIINYIWNLSLLSLASEDVVTYYAEVEDNDNVSGPKKSKTLEYTLRIPSIDELFKESSKIQEKAEDELTKTLQEAQELKKELENISKDMKKDKKELSWEEKEKVQSAAKKFGELQDKVDQIQKQMKQSTDKLEKNNLLSKETMQKYLELQKLLNELSTDEMKKAMEKLQQTLQSMDRKQTQQNMQNMKIDEEAFQKSLERTLNLLKRIQIEQKVDELIKKSQQLEQQQNELSEKTQKELDKKNNASEELSKQQKSIEKQSKEFQKDLQELAKRMEEFKDLPKDEAEKLEKEFEEQKNDELSKDAQESIQQQQKQQAMQKQSKISQNMKQMKKKLEGLQSSIMQQQQMQTFMDLTKLLHELVSMSEQQEALKDNSLNGERELSFNENARKQDNLKRTLENLLQKMGALAQKTFAISPEMGKELGDARRRMDQAISSLQAKSGNGAAENQAEAMKSMNQAALMMKQSMDNMMQQGGQGSSGMMSLMQQLGKLSGMQMGLNNMTQQMQQGNNGQMSQGQQAQMQRLAQQQSVIRKSLQQLNDEAKSTGTSKKIPTNLESVLKQMDEVIQDMKTEKIDDALIQKQEKILSRLLDAQRSINERDFEKDRESFTGTNVTRKSPADLKLSNGKKSDKLKDELNNVSREGYVKDYEELIRKYFESLQKGEHK